MVWLHAGLNVKLQLHGTWCHCQTCRPLFCLNRNFFSSSYHISEPLSLFLPPSFCSHFHSNSLTFPIFPKTGIAASSSGQLLFQCQVKILGESAIVSQRWNKSCVIWRRMTQSPSLRRPLIKRPIRGGGFAACLPTIPFHILSYSILIYAFVWRLNSPRKDWFTLQPEVSLPVLTSTKAVWSLSFKLCSYFIRNKSFFHMAVCSAM